MKKCLLSTAIAMAMALSAPTAIFATDNLVDANGNAVQSTVSGTPTVTQSSVEEETDWHQPTPWEMLEYSMAMTSSAVEGTLEVENETPASAGQLNLTTATPVIDGNDAGIMQVKVNSSSIGTNRHSDTSGTVSAYAHFNQKATSANCAISLQEKYNGSWRAATGLPVRAYTKSTTNVTSISVAKKFTLKKGKVYRAKIYVMDTNSSGSYYKTLYTGAF